MSLLCGSMYISRMTGDDHNKVNNKDNKEYIKKTVMLKANSWLPYTNSLAGQDGVI